MYWSVVPPFSEKKTVTCCDIDAFLQETWPFYHSWLFSPSYAVQIQVWHQANLPCDYYLLLKI